MTIQHTEHTEVLCFDCHDGTYENECHELPSDSEHPVQYTLNNSRFLGSSK